VSRPYSLADARRVLADVSGDEGFADDFFERYVEGHEAADYAHLLDQAGFAVVRPPAGRGWTGDVPLSQANAGLLVGGRFGSGLVPFGTPAYEAGLDSGDLLRSIDGRPATLEAWLALADRPPGTVVPLVVERRDGRRVETTITIAEDPTARIAAVEDLGRTLTPAQQAFREAWLGSQISD